MSLEHMEGKAARLMLKNSVKEAANLLETVNVKALGETGQSLVFTGPNDKVELSWEGAKTKKVEKKLGPLTFPQAPFNITVTPFINGSMSPHFKIEAKYRNDEEWERDSALFEKEEGRANVLDLQTKFGKKQGGLSIKAAMDIFRKTYESDGSEKDSSGAKSEATSETHVEILGLNWQQIKSPDGNLKKNRYTLVSDQGNLPEAIQIPKGMRLEILSGNIEVKITGGEDAKLLRADLRKIMLHHLQTTLTIKDEQNIEIDTVKNLEELRSVLDKETANIRASLLR